MDFLKDFDKSIDAMEVITTSEPPRYWYSTGNFVLNRIISGSFFKGVPQGRITMLAGPSGAGKSFLAANVVRSAQQAGAYVLVLDSENSLDDQFMSAIGVNTESSYKYVGVDTIPECSKVVSKFLTGYSKEYGNDPKAPQVIILIDSLDMLMTETEEEHFEKGTTKGDQGQRAKQLKALQRTLVNGIKGKNVSIVVTAQPYQAKAEQLLAGEGPWVIAQAVRFAPSLIVMLTKLKLRDSDDRKNVQGIRMKCEGHKTRFTKPFQTVTVEVPYDTGMDRYSGLLDVAVDMGVVTKAGSRYKLAGEDDSWYAKDLAGYAEQILVKAEAQTNAFLEANVSTTEIAEDQGETTEETAGRRRRKKS